MKKNFFKKPLAIGLILSLAVSSIAFGNDRVVTSTGTQTITGDSTYDPTVFSVVIPTAYTFSIDAFEKNSAGIQIHSPDYFIINKSNVDVDASIEITVSPVSGVAFMPKELVNITDLKNTDKQLYFAAVPAASLSIDATSGSEKVSNVVNSSLVEVSAVNTPSSNKKAASISFALAAATYNNGTFSSLAPSNKGVSSYRFVGKVNPFSAWEENDITATGKYTIQPVPKGRYVSEKPVAGALNVVEYNSADEAPTAKPRLLPSTRSNDTVSLNNKANIDYTLEFGQGAYAGDMFQNLYLEQTMIGSAAYSYDSSSKTITIKNTAPFYSTLIKGPGNYKLTVNFKNGKSAVSTLKIVY